MNKYSIEIKWAFIFTVVSLVWMLLEKLTGLHGPNIEVHAIYTNFFAIPATVMCVLTLLEKKKKYYKGNMSWKQGFFTGLRLTLGIIILSPVAQLITAKVISPEYFPNVIEYAVFTENMTRPAAEAYFNLKSYILQGMIGAAVMGTLTSAIVAFFTKTKKR